MNSQKGGNLKGHQETSRGDEYVHYLQGDDGFMSENVKLNYRL